MHMCTVVALEKFKIRISQGVPGGTKTQFLAIFAYFFKIFCFFLQFSIYKSCYIWITFSLEYPIAYFHDFDVGN